MSHFNEFSSNLYHILDKEIEDIIDRFNLAQTEQSLTATLMILDQSTLSLSKMCKVELIGIRNGLVLNLLVPCCQLENAKSSTISLFISNGRIDVLIHGKIEIVSCLEADAIFSMMLREQQLRCAALAYYTDNAESHMQQITQQYAHQSIPRPISTSTKFYRIIPLNWQLIEVNYNDQTCISSHNQIRNQQIVSKQQHSEIVNVHV
ncbi:hypothetical protein BDD26_1127 [Xenorhabdus cabanillasii]|uniref:Uncharacterized protein n=1 Tax=Xenorhabdus cabanillasii TaxID=351673 RepID=A0A3D9UAH8_9GAMM|nr:hypothetical protein [Xenorhabdus cabanillasii]REF26482.1 hypothetical protein BDD26_1127 [Xenorhabdus cabanillasii]